MTTRQFGSALLIVSIALAAACSREPAAPAAPAAPPAPTQAWSDFASGYIEEYFKAQPFSAVDAGRHEFDGQAPDWSREGIAKEVARLKAARDAANAYPASALSPQQRFERDYLVGELKGNIFWLERAEFPFKNPTWYISRLDPQVYLTRDYAPLEKRLEGYIGYARAIPKLAADIRANLRTPMPKTFVERGAAGFGGFADFFRSDVPKVFAPVKNAELQAQFKEANEAAAKAMEELKTWFESERANATEEFALGEQMFLEMLRETEGVDVPLQQLVAAGRVDLERNTRALREACKKYLPTGTIEACVAKMGQDKPRGGAVQGARQQLGELRRFVVEKKLVSIPGEDQARVEEAPPYNAANFAYINIPGPFEKPDVAWTYYVAPPDPKWTAEERAAYIPGKADLLYTSVHEVWPGHFLQFKHAQQNPSKIASLWIGYAYGEGWAHYAEEMMWEAGLGNGDPEQHIGQLTNAMLRDVRYISAIGLHTQGMTVEESEKMFRERAWSDPGNSRQQAARGTYDPGYLLYTLGKLMIRKMRTDWLAKQGLPADSPPQSWQPFHDQFLSYGGPPIPLVRKEMLGADGSLL
jgi:hypothetical protein